MSWREHRCAPAQGTLLCRMDSVPDGACKELRYGEGDGLFSLLLHRRGAGIRAYVNSCPHFSLPLNAHPDKFLLLADARIMCAWHCAVFRLDDGRCIAGPAQGTGLEPVPVAVVDGQIYLSPL
jgi:nitrite reductase/ring-hydroxylating ferredoxin subunit